MNLSGKKRLADFILIALLLLLALVCYLLFSGSGSHGSVAVVCVNGEEVARYSLAEEGRYELNGGSNILIIRDGCAWLEDADCPDRLCIKQGGIEKSGESIVCLPHRVIVTVEGGKAAESDAVSR